MISRNIETARRFLWTVLISLPLGQISACTLGGRGAPTQEEIVHNLGEFVSGFARSLLAAYLT